MRRWPVLVVTLAASCCIAADPALDAARWAPIAANEGDEYTTDCDKWFVTGYGFLSARQRLDGQLAVAREASQADGELVLGWQHFLGGHGILDEGEWQRFSLRMGTDPLAADRRAVVASAGAGYAAMPLLAVHADAGMSSERGGVLSAEAWLATLHVAAERDQRIGSARLGLGAIMPGSTSAWSGSICFDLARSWTTDRGNAGLPKAGTAFVVAATVSWSPLNRVIMTGEVTATDRAWRPGRGEDPLVAATAGFGVGF